MRKIYIILVVIFGLVFYLAHSKAAEKIDIRLDDEVGIVFLNKNMILVIGEEETTLLVVGKGKPDNLNKFYIHNLNVLALENNMTNVKATKQMILKDDYYIGDVTYSKRNGLIYISYKNNNLCVYMGGEYNISSCQFVYFYNVNVSMFTLYDYNEAIFYYYKTPLSKSILENVYEQSIDTYSIRDDELTIIRLNEEDYDIVVIDNE